MWTDSHCHIDDPAVIEKARAAGVTRLITVGTDVAASRAAIDTASAHDGVWATAGVHPHEARHGLAGLEELLAAPEVVAVGECGLDYHYDHSPRDTQRDAFAAQVELAHRHQLALVIHTREAWDDTFAILDEAGIPGRVVFHCFTGGPDEARRALDRGAALSFSGIVTFKGADDIRAAARVCPDDRLLVETDAPYLAPAPHRGKPNEPAFVPLVGAGVAEARGVATEDVENLSWGNAERLFNLVRL